jgi:hypothetical protein
MPDGPASRDLRHDRRATRRELRSGSVGPHAVAVGTGAAARHDASPARPHTRGRAAVHGDGDHVGWPSLEEVVATPHSLIGALAASRGRSLSAAFALGVLSHLVADRVPHSDYDPLGPVGKLRGGADLALAGLLLVSVEASVVQWAGAIGGLAPDLLALASRAGDPFSRLVHQRAHSRRRPGRLVGVGVQAAVALCCYAALAARESSSATPPTAP